MRTKFKPWCEPYIEEHQEAMLKTEDIASLDNFYLEIGSGKGQFLVNMALSNQNETFIGVERNVTCCGFSCKKLVESQVNNGKLIYDNADSVLMNVKNETVKGIFLNFSDPWPKIRHSKRRLTAESYLESYYRVLKPHSRLIFKTDNKDLFDFSLEKMGESKFKIISKDDNYDGKDPFDYQTEYEEKFRSEGQPIYRVVLEKND